MTSCCLPESCAVFSWMLVSSVETCWFKTLIWLWTFCIWLSRVALYSCCFDLSARSWSSFAFVASCCCSNFSRCCSSSCCSCWSASRSPSETAASAHRSDVVEEHSTATAARTAATRRIFFDCFMDSLLCTTPFIRFETGMSRRKSHPPQGLPPASNDGSADAAAGAPSQKDMPV